MATLPQMSLADIRTAAQERADMVNSSFIATGEWTTFINGSLYELYDVLIQKFGDDYYVTQSTATTSGTTQFITLPADFYKLCGVDLQVSSPDWWVTLRPFEFAERNRFALRNYQSFYGLSNLRYHMQGGSLMLTPQPAAGQTLRIWYIPRLAPLVNDTDVADGVSGWLDYVVVDAARKALMKEESDVTALAMELASLRERIESAAENRDAGNPSTVADTASSNPWTPWGGNEGGGWGW